MNHDQDYHGFILILAIVAGLGREIDALNYSGLTILRAGADPLPACKE